MIEQVLPDIFKIQIPLPRNPLEQLILISFAV